MDPRKRYLIDTPDGPMTRGEAAVHYGIPKGTLIRRIWQGWPQEKWFIPSYKPPRKPKKTPKRKGRFITPYGRVALHDIADILGLSWDSVRGRLYVLGWSEEEAFNTPANGKPGRNFVLPPDVYRSRRAACLEADYQDRITQEHKRRLAYNKKRKARRLREKQNEPV